MGAADAGKWSLQVFYDGACPLCSREMGVYRRRDREHRVQWIDIATPDFDARHYQLDPQRLQQVMHARTPDGRVYTQVNAFVKIWQALPPRPWTTFLRLILKLPGTIAIANVLYRLFARNRYRLTGRCTPLSCPVGPPADLLTPSPGVPSGAGQTSSLR